MAVLLEKPEEQDGENTIQHRIKRYVLVNSYYLFISAFVCILMVGVIFYGYFGINRQHMLLHTFYENINELDMATYDYVLNRSEENYGRYAGARQDVRTSFEVIKGLVKDEVYARESRDIGYMLERICEEEDGTDAGSDAELRGGVTSSFYTEKHEIVTIIQKTYQNMYRRFLALSELRSHHVFRLVICFLLLYIVLLCTELVDWLRRAGKLSFSLAEPIMQFSDHMKQIFNNGFSRLEPVKIREGTYSELRTMGNVYNRMTEIMNQYQKEREVYYQNQIEVQQELTEKLKISVQLEELRYKALQEQINPHFLFNTMNMMLQSAYINEDMETAELLGYTSDLLRYALNASVRESVTLEDELCALADYISIQKKRFGGRIQFTVEQEQACQTVKIPGLILQPLVENAISHGLKTKMRDGKVEVRTYMGDGEVLLEVKDNGIGIEKTRLEQIRKAVRQKECSSICIGLYNVYQRLQIYYHGNVRMEIFSEENQGTHVKIRIDRAKREKGEAEYVQGSDCG